MNKTITLHQFPRVGKFPNLSPFCMKLETYLRMTHREYQTINLLNPRKSAVRGKLPFITYGNEVIGDSSLIIERLEADSEAPLDQHLNAEQRAEKICIQRMLEDHLYWIIVYGRWCSTAGWPVWSGGMKKRLPPFIGTVILNRIKAQVVKQLVAQGIGRFDESTIFNFGLTDLQALNTKLGNRTWYFNDQPSVIDAIIYAFLGSCISAIWPSPLKDYVLAQPNLMQYYNHIQDHYFPELG